MVTVRYFAGAAEAAGLDEETLCGTTVGEVRAAMVGAHGPGFAQVLGRCAVLVSGARAGDTDPVPAGAVVDVLPPFAGG